MATIAELRKMNIDELEVLRDEIRAKIDALKLEFRKIGKVKQEKLAAPQIAGLKKRQKAIAANLKMLESK